jgi:MAF protein
MQKLILASASPRRRELLAMLGVAFEVRPSHVNEDPLPNESPLETQHRITQLKAHTAVNGANGDDAVVVIAADTTVLLDGEMLNKPVDVAEARTMLRKLRGRAHEVQTCVVVCEGQADETYVVSSQVFMRGYSDVEIESYIASGDPFDKAGSYAVQHPQFNPVQEIRGCPLNVVGLPLCVLGKFQKNAYECKVGDVACVGNVCARDRS